VSSHRRTVHIAESSALATYVLRRGIPTAHKRRRAGRAKRWGQENPGPIFLPPFSCLSLDFASDFHGFVTGKATEEQRRVVPSAMGRAVDQVQCGSSQRRNSPQSELSRASSKLSGPLPPLCPSVASVVKKEEGASTIRTAGFAANAQHCPALLGCRFRDGSRRSLHR
jgi:hypothetical protein